MKKIKGLRRIFDGSRLFRLILEFMDVGIRFRLPAYRSNGGIIDLFGAFVFVVKNGCFREFRMRSD